RCDFGFQPWQARRNFRSVRFLVQAALSALFPFEMFHSIRDVNLIAINTGLHQRAIQQLARRPHEWLSLKIFFVAGLLSDKKQQRPPGPRAKYRLSGSLPEVTCLAFLCLGLKSTQRTSFHSVHSSLAHTLQIRPIAPPGQEGWLRRSRRRGG